MAVDSLVLAELFELMGGPGGSQSDIPALMNAAGVGATFQLLAPSSTGGTALGNTMAWDLGTPQPTVSLVQSLLLDGERPFGARASNRTITLPVKITAPDQLTLSAAKEYLMQAVDAPTWTMSWTPASTGLTQVFDCFRALPTVYSYGFLPGQPSPIAIITLTFQALPYGRSSPDALTSVAFASPILGGVAAPPAAVVLDSFGTVSGTNWSQTTQFVVGPHSARYTPPSSASLPVTYSASGLSANITGLTALSVWFGQSYDTAHWRPFAAFASNVTLRWTLTDNSGHTLSFHRTHNKAPWSSSASSPKWTRITAPIPQGSASFNYANVASYSVTMSNFVKSGKSAFVRMNAWLDSVTANPPSLAVPASQRGVMYNVMGIPGTARTPVSCQFQLPASGTVSTELSGAGVWWPPVGVTSVMAECIGGGGAGSSISTTGQGGGGGGAEYAAEPVLTVAAGTPVPYSCGAGGSSGATQQVVTFTTAGTGNWTCPANVTTVKAECWGGGGRGADGGAGGGGGEYAAEASLAVTAGKTYAFTVGAGGIFTAGTAHGANGQSSTFAGDSVTVTAHGGVIPTSGGTIGGIGGHGSTNTTHNNGGPGGTSPSYGGGGGGGSAASGGVGNTGGNGSGNTGGTGAAAISGGGAGGNGASNPGFPQTGFSPGGGGGGGYGNLGNQPGGAGAPGQVQVTFTVNAGSPVNGGNTTFGSASTTGTIVTAHGGGSAPANSATNGTGAGGSTNTTHFTGGNGGLGGTNGGGGGGSGGSAAIGSNGASGASGGAGAQAVAGGGKGANGGVTAPANGDGASPPGGGGGGSTTATTPVSGGAGGNGRVIVTWTPPITPFSTLIAHRPGAASPPELNPIVPVSNTFDTPNNSVQYPVPSLVSGVNALFKGTYTVVLTNYSWDSPATSRSISVTVNQFEYLSGPVYAQTLTRTLTPATDVINGIVIMGEMTLPTRDIDPSVTSAFFTVSISDSDTSDQFLDVLFLDTQGSTVMVNLPNNSYINMFIDEPAIDRDLGYVLGSDLDRSQAVSLLQNSVISGSPFYIQQGDNLFLAYTTAGAPNLAVSFLNRWYLERQV